MLRDCSMNAIRASVEHSELERKENKNSDFQLSIQWDADKIEYPMKKYVRISYKKNPPTNGLNIKRARKINLKKLYQKKCRKVRKN